MFSLSENKSIFFLSISIIIFLQIIKNILSTYINNCPEEINNNYNSLYYLESGNFIRFSQCFYCIKYSKGGAKRHLCILNNTIYEFELYTGCKSKYNLSLYLNGNYYNLLSINETYKNFDYCIYFIDYNKHINFLHYSLAEEKNELIEKKIIHNLKIEGPKSFSCQIHIFNRQLLCFYIIKPYIYSEVFDINKNFSTINKTNITFSFKNNSKITLKTSINSDKNKILLCWEQSQRKAYYNYYLYNKHCFMDSKPLNFWTQIIK